MNVRNPMALTQALMSALNQIDVTPEDKESLLNVAIAKTVAYSLAIPSSPADIRTFYNQNYRPVALEAIDAINESYVINVKDVLELVWKIYHMRYAVVHDPERVDMVGLLAAMEVKPMTSDEMDVIIKRPNRRSNADSLSRVCRVITRLLNDEY